MQSLILKVIKFGLVGLSGIAVDFIVTWLFKERFGVNKYVANAAGFATAVLSNFLLNYLWTFRGNTSKPLDALGIFIVFSIIGLMLNSFFLFLLHEKRSKNFYLAKLIAIGLVFCWNFSANYFFNFHSAR